MSARWPTWRPHGYGQTYLAPCKRHQDSVLYDGAVSAVEKSAWVSCGTQVGWSPYMVVRECRGGWRRYDVQELRLHHGIHDRTPCSHNFETTVHCGAANDVEYARMSHHITVCPRETACCGLADLHSLVRRNASGDIGLDEKKRTGCERTTTVGGS